MVIQLRNLWELRTLDGYAILGGNGHAQEGLLLLQLLRAVLSRLDQGICFGCLLESLIVAFIHDTVKNGINLFDAPDK